MSNDLKPKKYDLEERTAKSGESVVMFARMISKDAITLPIISQLIRAGTSIGANYSPKPMMLSQEKTLSTRLEFVKRNRVKRSTGCVWLWLPAPRLRKKPGNCGRKLKS